MLLVKQALLQRVKKVEKKEYKLEGVTVINGSDEVFTSESQIKQILKEAKDIKDEPTNKGEYKRYLTEISETKNYDQEKKFNEMLKRIQIPRGKNFYRYTALNEYAIFQLLQGYVYLASPNTFNDPFDCKAYINSGKLSRSYGLWSSMYGQGIKDFLKERYSEVEKLEGEGRRIKLEEIREKEAKWVYEGIELKDKIEKNKFDALILKVTIDRYKKELDERLKIACFTTKNDNMPMWYNYADRHKGICIEYDFENVVYENNKLICNGGEYEHELFLPVFYTQKFNPYLLGLESEELIRVSCLVNSILKHDDWRNEDEWRLVSYNNDLREFKAFPIKAIYFGTKTDDIVINKLVHILKNNERKIEFFKMREDVMGLKAYKIEGV